MKQASWAFTLMHSNGDNMRCVYTKFQLSNFKQRQEIEVTGGGTERWTRCARHAFVCNMAVALDVLLVVKGSAPFQQKVHIYLI